MQSNEYHLSYLDAQQRKVFIKAANLCRLIPSGFLPILYVVAELIYRVRSGADAVPNNVDPGTISPSHLEKRQLIYSLRLSTEILAQNLTHWV